MATVANDTNLTIALTILQFIALTLPAIGIFLQIIDRMEPGADIDEVNKYHIARSSVIFLILAALLLLFSIGSNMVNFPFGVIISKSTEAWILTTGIALTWIGAAIFGFSIIVRLIRVKRGRATIIQSYYRTIRDIFE